MIFWQVFLSVFIIVFKFSGRIVLCVKNVEWGGTSLNFQVKIFLYFTSSVLAWMGDSVTRVDFSILSVYALQNTDCMPILSCYSHLVSLALSFLICKTERKLSLSQLFLKRCMKECVGKCFLKYAEVLHRTRGE